MAGSVAFPISPPRSLSLLVSRCSPVQGTPYTRMTHTASRPHGESMNADSSPSLSPLIPGPLLSSLQLRPRHVSSRTLLFCNVQPLWQDSFTPLCEATHSPSTSKPNSVRFTERKVFTEIRSVLRLYLPVCFWKTQVYGSPGSNI